MARYEITSEVFHARVDSFETGLAGTIGVQILNSSGTAVVARTTAGIVENPAGSGSYLATLTAPADAGDYTIFWDNGSISPSTTTGEQLVVSSTSTPFTPPTGDTYVTAEELFRVLKVRSATDAQTDAANRVLLTATREIDSEIDRADDDPAFTDAELALIQTVCLDRAADLWRHTESIPGVLGGLDDVVQATPGRYSWERYAQRLAPLKSQWGLA